MVSEDKISLFEILVFPVDKVIRAFKIGIEPSFIHLSVDKHFFTITVVNVVDPPTDIVIPISSDETAPTIDIALVHLAFVNRTTFENSSDHALRLILHILAHVNSTAELKIIRVYFRTANLQESFCNNLFDIKWSQSLPFCQSPSACFVSFVSNVNFLVKVKQIVKSVVFLKNFFFLLESLNFCFLLFNLLFVLPLNLLLLLSKIVSFQSQFFIFDLELLFELLLILNLSVFFHDFINI